MSTEQDNLANRLTRRQAYDRYQAYHAHEDRTAVQAKDAGSAAGSLIPLPQKRYNQVIFRLSLGSGDAPTYSLALYVNPGQMAIKRAQKITREQTIAGWVEYHWGEDLVSISCDGVTGAFQDPKTGLLFNPYVDSYGRSRRDSEAWKRFEDLLLLFKNNGYQWSLAKGSSGATEANSQFYGEGYDQGGYPIKAGKLTMEYDGQSYDGYFENFSFKEAGDTPYMLSYSFSFKAYAGSMTEGAFLGSGNMPGGIYPDGTSPFGNFA